MKDIHKVSQLSSQNLDFKSNFLKYKWKTLVLDSLHYIHCVSQNKVIIQILVHSLTYYIYIHPHTHIPSIDILYLLDNFCFFHIFMHVFFQMSSHISGYSSSRL
jgi:hypothetical protein